MKITVSERAQNYVRNRAQDHMSANITIYHSEGIQFDELTGMVTVPTKTAIYMGKARIWQVDIAATILAGEADLSIANTNVSIPWNSVVPRKDDVVYVRSNTSDKTVVGRAFRVIGINGGGLIGGTIRLSCSSLADSAQWRHE